MGFASPGRARGSDESGRDDALCILNADWHHGDGHLMGDTL